MKNNLLATFDKEFQGKKCEICNMQATAGLIADHNPLLIKYTCQDHWIPVHERIIAESREKSKYELKKEPWPQKTKKNHLLGIEG